MIKKYAIPPNIAPMPPLLREKIYSEEEQAGDIFIREINPLSKEEFITLYEAGELSHWNAKEIKETKNEI